MFDPYHTNSIQALPEHRILLSMRDTSGVYEVEQSTGKVLWEISPNHDTFKPKRGVLFHFQHDARLEGKHLETLTLFDDEAGPPLYGPSKGLVLRIKGKSLKLVHAYENPRHTLAVAEGSMQVLPGGKRSSASARRSTSPSSARTAERKKNGKLLFEAELPKGDGTYRVMRFPWSATPNTKPAVVAKREGAEEVAVYASWNGATEVAKWEVLAGEEADSLSPITTAEWSNFETRIPVSSTGQGLRGEGSQQGRQSPRDIRSGERIVRRPIYPSQRERNQA